MKWQLAAESRVQPDSFLHCAMGGALLHSEADLHLHLAEIAPGLYVASSVSVQPVDVLTRKAVPLYNSNRSCIQELRAVF